MTKQHLNNEGRLLRCGAKTPEACDYYGNPHFQTIAEGKDYMTQQASQEAGGAFGEGSSHSHSSKTSENLTEAPVSSYGNPAITVEEQQRIEEERAASELSNRTFTIYEDKLDKFKAQVRKANERLEKNGVEGRFEYTTEDITEYVKNEEGEEIEVKRVKVVMNATDLSYNGYTFMARVEEVSPGNFVAYSPAGKELNGWRPKSMDCEHCGKTRHRAKVYAIKDESGKMSVVGGSCVELYTGMKPNGLTSLEFDTDELEKDSSSSPRGQVVLSSDRILQIAYVLTKDSGYRNANSENPTSMVLSNVLWPGRLPSDRKFAQDIEAQAEAVDVAQIRAELDEALKDSNSDWALNVKALLDTERIGVRGVNTLASSMAALHKYKERKAREVPWSPGFIGSPKERLKDVPVKIVSVYTDEEVYGYGEEKTVHKVTMQTRDGKKVQWKSYGGEVPPVGTEVLMTATVKDHSTWKGIDSTRVTRAKMSEVE